MAVAMRDAIFRVAAILSSSDAAVASSARRARTAMEGSGNDRVDCTDVKSAEEIRMHVRAFRHARLQSIHSDVARQ